MPARRPPSEHDEIQRLLSFGPEELSLDQRIEIAQRLRAQSPELGRELDAFILDRLCLQHVGLQDAQRNVAKLKGYLDKLSATPWVPALFLRKVQTSQGLRADVQMGNSRQIVAFAEGLDPDALGMGDEVYLSAERTAIMARSPYGVPLSGEAAFFEGKTTDGRLRLRSGDREMVLEPAHTLRDVELQPGDLVRFEWNAHVAFERIERNQGRQYLLTDVLDISPEMVGGQEQNLGELFLALVAILVDPDGAKRFRLDGATTIFMYGPPGVGKTLMARVVAAMVQRTSGKKCRFAVVKPGEWQDPYVGVTEMNIRNCFKALHQAAKDGFAILFLDEIETIGRARGAFANHHADGALGALLAEINGFKNRSNVAIIAASNRKDLLDPALLERLSEIEIEVKRPDMNSARAIFNIHLHRDLPFSPNGSRAEATRQELIELAVSRFYSPNADNEVCTLKFRDGKTRSVSARELASGRLFEQVCKSACREAFRRYRQGGDTGLRVSDMAGAVGSAIDRLRTTLTRHNVHAYLTDLPQDVDVVAVEPVVRKVTRPHGYLKAA